MTSAPHPPLRGTLSPPGGERGHPPGGDRLARRHSKRAAALLLVVVAIALLMAIEPLHRGARDLIAAAEPVIREHEVLGAIVFVALSALSAMFVFFSTTLVVPIAIDAFGQLQALLLLWLGWIAGGVTAYAIGRLLGRRVASWFIEPRKLLEYEQRARSLVSFRHVLLFQIAVPSEIPGYVLGLARCRFRIFVAAMALGELPFAIGAIFLGESFLTRNYALLLAIGITGVALSWIAFRLTSRRSSDARIPHSSPTSARQPP